MTERSESNRSRTKLSFQNSKISLIYYFAGLILEFISRRVFIHSLGADVVGLNTTAFNLLGFLNLAELGIGTAVAVTLYKPIFEHNYLTISEIITLQGNLYKKIAITVGAGGCILMSFFPIIFKNIELPMWYAYASFAVLLYGALLTYFFNYKQILLAADQKNYQILFSYKTIILLGTLVQIIILKLFSHGYIWWLIIQFIFPTIATISLSVKIRQEYPFLRKTSCKFNNLRLKYPEVVTKIKQVFFHRISTYVLLQVSPLVLYLFSDLKMVTVYGNYMIICTGLIRLLSAIFSSMAASIGNLIAEKSTKYVFSIFEELFSIRFAVVMTLCFTVFHVADLVITLWVGSSYLLSTTQLTLIVIYLFQNANRTTVDNFLQGYGLYRDIMAPIIETLLNLGLSIILGYYYGLTGILIAINMSLFVIVGIWKPYFLFKSGFNYNYIIYVKLLAKHLVCSFVAWVTSDFIYMLLLKSNNQTIETLILKSTVCIVSYFSLIFILVYFSTSGLKKFTNHIFHYIKV